MSLLSTVQIHIYVHNGTTLAISFSYNPCHQAPHHPQPSRICRRLSRWWWSLSLCCSFGARPAPSEYLVGGDDGWGFGDYDAWANARSFAPGDVLLFEYVKGQHNVYEVTEAAHRSCDDSGAGAVLATYDSGSDMVVLAEAKTYWFICQIPGHCMGGMKLAVIVSSAAAGPAAPPFPSSAAARGASPISWAAWAGLVLLGVRVLVNRAS
uniref:Uncharacterized protein n=1 Tax=Avena sativa TaxID=4498 RepID=A0ACD5UK50_AVESA